jgi:hypothetical protein
MHQQIRMRLAQRGGGSDTGGHMSEVGDETDAIRARAGALLALLTDLEAQGFNLQVVGGHGLEMGGELVFSVHEGPHKDPGHGDHHSTGADDDGHAHDETERCRRYLEGRGLRPEIIVPITCEVDDEPGALARCLEQKVPAGHHVDEIFVGAPEHDKVLIQVTTVQAT